jgi:sigma-B regulation protein RsbU (phosphoserine phosphatase)
VSIESVQRSFDLVSMKSDEFSESFYKNLFADHPIVKPLFDGVDPIRQRKKLFAMITLIVTHVGQMHVVLPVLRELGRRHVDYGVTADMYEAFVDAFLKSLGQMLPDRWDRALAESWRTVLEEICVPLIDAARAGAGGVGADGDQSDELRLLMELSGQQTVAPANARLFGTFLAKRIHDHDLEIARSVQRTLLPAELPQIAGYEIDACYEPAREVGGDYYDCRTLPDGRVYVAFGDVSGKGVPAAIIMSRLASAVQTTMQFASGIETAIDAINRHMCDRAAEGRFVTFLLLILDPVAHRLQLANAGHRPPLVVSPDGGTAELEPGIAGIPLGILDDHRYATAERDLEPGQAVVLLTDGVEEARGAGGEWFGLERVKASLQRHLHAPGGLASGLLEDVRRHALGRPANDDVAIVALSRR